MALSYSQGIGTTPLLGETIGENLDRTVARVPRPRGAGRAPPGRAADLRRARARTSTRRRARSLASACARATASASGRRTAPSGCVVQYATAKLGVILVNINPAYRTDRAGVRAAPVRLPAARLRAGVQDLGLPRDGRRGPRATCPSLERVVFLDDDWDELLARRARTQVRAGRELDFDDPINIQYTSGTTGFPKGATLSHHNILNNGFFVGECCGYTEDDRVCIPVPFYHCFGMVMGNLGCVTHGACMVIPAPAFEPEATLEAVAERALHGALRRADDVHRRARAPRLRRLRPVARCAPGSWPARRARSRSCARSSTACTWTR